MLRFFTFRNIAVLALAGVAASCNGAPTAQDKVAHGRYLVGVMGCGDCHTPGYFLGRPDMTKVLAGSDVGFFMPGLGYFYPPNLTPDATGLGAWSEAEIVTALRTGNRPDGRQLSPLMPWMDFAHLTDEDAGAIAAYLKSMAPIANKVPDPAGADHTPPGLFMAVLSPSMTVLGLPPAAAPGTEAPAAPTPQSAPPGTIP